MRNISNSKKSPAYVTNASESLRLLVTNGNRDFRSEEWDEVKTTASDLEARITALLKSESKRSDPLSRVAESGDPESLRKLQIG